MGLLACFIDIYNLWV